MPIVFTPAPSWLSQVDPLLKIGGLSVYITLTLLCEHPGSLAVLSLGVLILLSTAAIPRRMALMGYCLSGIGIVALVHLLLGGGPHAIALTALRLFIFISASAALMLSTDPAHLLRALRRLPLPPGILLGVSVMWRSLPVLRREFRAIRRACRLEGVQVGIQHPKAFFRYMLVPLAFGMTSFADELTLALTSRGITLTGSPLRPPGRFGRSDLVFLLLCGSAAAGAVGIYAWA